MEKPEKKKGRRGGRPDGSEGVGQSDEDGWEESRPGAETDQDSDANLIFWAEWSVWFQTASSTSR